MQTEKITAIVLAGGSGKRMGGTVKKQYMLLAGHPVLYYSLDAFQKSCVDTIILVTNEKEYCQKEIVETYHFDKVTKIVPGGAERYDSVYAGLLAAEGSSYVLIHDGARPFVSQEMIKHSLETVKKYQACAVGMPVKDTIKIVDKNQFTVTTPKRETVWQVQTPQTFSYPLILAAYEKVLAKQVEGITDDTMVAEYQSDVRVKLIEGSYDNMKITTPEDITVAEALLKTSQNIQE